ncbi:hypothetical protein BDV96DRAFT_101408 [Lophiotrema nucula]|uniref:AhpD-like protein n=1 Tax=Lophiotrema nucula TaxID=690887 RepID=A0A6A5Z6A6_9PLEO|nr:hypothetical protein BDV96DRAFT_101408 [Lophiotrema nucula]
MNEEARALINALPAKAEASQAQDSWYCIAACSFAACSQGTFVADVYRKAIEGHVQDHEANKRVLRRIKESLLKTAVIYGVPRLINAGRSLISALPNPELDNEIISIRNHIKEPSTTEQRGLVYMRNIFGADLDPFATWMDENWPDLRTYVMQFIYGYYQSDVSVIDAITTSQLNIATLIPMDVAPEVAWHMRGLVRNGGTLEQLQFASDIATEVCRITNVELKNRMPLPEEVINEERLIHI